MQASLRNPFVCLAIFVLLALAIYWPSLGGGAFADDQGYFVDNPYTAEISLQNTVAIFDPSGDARFFAANYAPVHLLFSAFELRVFGDDPRPYHLVNVLIHGLNATLLVMLFLTSGLSLGLAFSGGLLFLVHPANVEAVAWVSQLKTNAALAFSLGALLAFERYPKWATLSFVLGLLTKASAAFALPMALALCWVRRAERRESSRRWIWMGVWALAFCLYAIPQVTAFSERGGVFTPELDDPAVHLRTIAATGARYLVMAGTSWGISPAAEPAPATSPVRLVRGPRRRAARRPRCR